MDEANGELQFSGESGQLLTPAFSGVLTEVAGDARSTGGAIYEGFYGPVVAYLDRMETPVRHEGKTFYLTVRGGGVELKAGQPYRFYVEPLSRTRPRPTRPRR